LHGASSPVPEVRAGVAQGHVASESGEGFARGKFPLLHEGAALYSRPFNQLEITMARICAVTGRRPVKGSIINRKGQSKKSGGIGTHVTSITKRKFRPNLQRIRVRMPNGGTKRVWVSVKAIKAGLVEKV
jgi:large subunit ribosomal protein L28